MRAVRGLPGQGISRGRGLTMVGGGVGGVAGVGSSGGRGWNFG